VQQTENIFEQGGNDSFEQSGNDSGVLPQARVTTRAYAYDLWALVKEYGSRHAPASPSPQPHTGPVPPTRMHVPALRYLRLTPALLTVLFIISFVWDFPGMSLRVWDESVALDGLLRMLSVSGLIGYLTNWLAVAMLFQPRQRRPIFGQGLIPAQRELVIARLAQAISERLINAQLIHQQIEANGLIARARESALQTVRGMVEDPEFRRDLKLLVIHYVEQVVASKRVRQELVQLVMDKMKQQATGFSGIILNLLRHFKEEELEATIDDAIRELPGSLDQLLDRGHQLLDTLPLHIEARSEELEEWVTQAVLHFVQQLDVNGLLIANMGKYDEAQLEDLLKNTSNEQFNYIKYLGGVLGLFGGLVIWQPVPALILFGVLGLTLWLLDEALLRLRNP
jgi:uncharacterized membrane protein YheB (UPF0754 family)